MRNVPLVILSVICVISISGAGYLFFVNSRLADDLTETEMRLSVAESNIVVQQQALEQAREARAVLEAHLDRVTANAERWRALASDLSTREGVDEALNPYERAVLDSLRGR